jgi:nicotinamidase-related amidase
MTPTPRKPKPAEDAGTALVILDMINLFDYTGGAALARHALAALPAIVRLRRRFDDASAPVVYVNDNFSQWRHDFPQLVAICQAQGGASREIADALLPRAGDFHVLKPKHSGFLATPLDILLRSLGVRRVVLCGIAADACILATAQDAKMREYEVWIPSDATAAQTDDRKQAALKILRSGMLLDVGATRRVRGLFPT